MPTTSDLRQRQLRTTRPRLDQRWTSLNRLLTATIGRPSGAISVDHDYQANGVWTGLQGSQTERITRNRGSGRVAPFVQLPDNLSAWLGYQEVWDLETGREPFVFRQASLTIHIGEPGDPVKPQILRLEWPGLRNWHKTGVGFQSPDAGHPHWQFDLLESLSALSKATAAVTEFPGDESELENFDEVTVDTPIAARVLRLTLERMHLASAAPWWLERKPEFGSHQLNAPSDLQELSRWLVSAIHYLKQELGRCELRA